MTAAVPTNEWNEEAEQYALAVALMNAWAARLLARELQASDFGQPIHQRLFSAIEELVADGGAVSPVILSDHLEGEQWFKEAGGSPYLNTLCQLPALATHASDYAKIIKVHARRRCEARIAQDLIDGRIDAAAACEALRAIVADTPTIPVENRFIDWGSFWQRDQSQVEWVFPDVLARGRGHALYATHKAGKSLLMLFIAATLATGPEQIVVVYLDYEMGEDDLQDRLQDMGYGSQDDLSRLKYALLPSLPPLDTQAGAKALTELLQSVQADWAEHHLVVVIDTIGRAIEGEENSADTFRAFYSHTGIQLKRRGVTWARLDHGGKDAAKGARGSSGKGDDVDVVWRLSKTQNGVSLTRDVARMNWVPEKVTFGMTNDPLTYRRLAGDWPDGTEEAVEALDRLAVAPDVSVRVASSKLREADEGRRTEVVSAAQRWRKEREGEQA